jgi:hypothetical protein
MYADTTGRKLSTAAHREIVATGIPYLLRTNSGRWYIMRGQDVVFGDAARATLADCQAEFSKFDGSK